MCFPKVPSNSGGVFLQHSDFRNVLCCFLENLSRTKIVIEAPVFSSRQLRVIGHSHVFGFCDAKMSHYRNARSVSHYYIILVLSGSNL
jgi:hypothetical protein